MNDMKWIMLGGFIFACVFPYIVLYLLYFREEKPKCPDCEGEGIVVSYGYEPDPTKECPKCKGTGQKEMKPYRPTHKCKVCNGSGWAGYFSCSTCRGTGQAEDKDDRRRI